MFRFTIRELLIALFVVCLQLHADTYCSADDGVNQSHVDEIVALVERMPCWVFTPVVPDDPTPEAQLGEALERVERASRIEEAMNAVAKYKIEEIRSAVQKIAASRLDQKEDRLFVLNSFLFAIPDKVAQRSPAWKYVVSGFLPSNATDEDSTHWPWVARKNGTYRHAIKAHGFSRMGPPYKALEAFDALHAHFGLRPVILDAAP